MIVHPQSVEKSSVTHTGCAWNGAHIPVRVGDPGMAVEHGHFH